MAAGLSAMIGADAVQALDAEQRRHLEMLFFLEGTRRLRHEYLAALRSEPVRAFGDDGWKIVVKDAWPPIDYFAALPAFYRDCVVNLNFTSIQMPRAVNQRVFDCPAAGGFLLTDAQEDLKRLFAEDEVAAFATVEECREKVRYYSAIAGARQAVIGAARKRILGEHTYAHRLRAIARWVMEHLG
jgi:spore maturation protein CgeB